MRKTLLVLLLVCSCSLLVVAQEHSKADVFAGYQWTSVDTGTSGIDRQNFNGWNAAVSGYFTKNFGITGDFSGAYKTVDLTKVKIHSYMFGPVFRAPGKVSPFVHALFGGAHASGDSLGDSSFAYAFGGGLDLGVKKVAVRVGQFDYLGTRFGGENQKNFRYSAGIVFKF